MTSESLKSFRLWMGVTQGELGDMLSVTRGTIDNWENRKHPPGWLDLALSGLLARNVRFDGEEAPTHLLQLSVTRKK